MTEDLKSHVDDIINAISDKTEKELKREELEEELNRFMEYGVPLDQAKETLINKFGGVTINNVSENSSERKLISNLQPNERSVNLLCHVIALNPKEITVKGQNRKIFYGIFGDESGTIPFTAWDSELDFKKGDVVEISNAYTREWQGSVQLNLGDRVSIKKTDKDKLPKTAFKPKELKVVDLKSGIGSVDVTAKILDIKEREVNINGDKKKVFSGTIGDETGKAQFTSWNDFNIKNGDVIRIKGGYVKSWKGIPQLTFDERAEVKKLDKGKISEKNIESVKLAIHKLIEKRGAIDVEIEGEVIEIRQGSGFIKRCPECNRPLQNEECSVHGKVSGEPDLRLKLVVDDGTGGVSAILNREVTEKILDLSLEECKKMEDSDLLDVINKKLFAQKIKLRGNALGDEFGTSLITKDAGMLDINLKEEIEKISLEVEELL